MKVGELMEALKGFDSEMEVTVADGFNCTFYRANADRDFVVVASAIEDNCVEICVGGCLEEEDE